VGTGSMILVNQVSITQHLDLSHWTVNYFLVNKNSITMSHLRVLGVVEGVFKLCRLLPLNFAMEEIQ